jgi:hypothetical protein
MDSDDEELGVGGIYRGPLADVLLAPPSSFSEEESDPQFSSDKRAETQQEGWLKQATASKLDKRIYRLLPFFYQ